jgi:hypothetical protein
MTTRGLCSPTLKHKRCELFLSCRTPEPDMNHDERKLAGFKCILLLTICLILSWVLQAMEVAIDHIGCCTSKKQGSKEGRMVPNQTPIGIEVFFLAFPVCRSDSSSCASGGLQGARRHTTHYPNQPSRDITFFFCIRCCCCCCCFALPVCSPYLSLKRLGDQRDYGMGREASSQDQRRRRSANNNNNNKGGGNVC